MSATKVSVRRAQKGDGKRLRTLHQASIRVLCSRHYGPEQILEWAGPERPRDYEERIHRLDLLVAEEEDEIIGFSQLDTRCGELQGLYVDPLYVGSGVGSRLLAATEDRARSKGLRALAVNATLNSTGFYESRGWVARGNAKNTLPGGTALPCVRMAKSLGKDSS